MIYGYCRVSTTKQNITRQIENIKAEYPTAIITQEKYSGRKTAEEREKFNRLLKKVQTGDTIVFDSVSRMSRNAEDGIKLYMELYEKGINLVFLKEPYINTSTYKHALQGSIETVGNEIADIYIKATNEVLKLLATQQIKQAFEQSQKEVDDLRQRTKEGLRVAKSKGKTLGVHKGETFETKKSKTAKKQIEKHSKDFFGTLNDSDCIKLCGISRNTFYKYKRELMEKNRMLKGQMIFKNEKESEKNE